MFYHYDRLMEENKALKARIKEMEDEKAIVMLWVVLGGGFGSEILVYWHVGYLHRKGWHKIKSAYSLDWECADFLVGVCITNEKCYLWSHSFTMYISLFEL